MAPLAHALALLAMAVAPAAFRVVPLDMAEDSFDDQYRDCHPAMTAALPALNRSEFQENPVFAQAWAKVTDMWQKRGVTDSPLTPDQATAVIAFAMDDLHSEFNEAVSTAGRSPQEYRDNFKFKGLHFLLTDALATLRKALRGKCREFQHRVCGVQFVAQQGDTVRFDRFTIVWRSQTPSGCSGKGSLLQVYTCQWVNISSTAVLLNGGVVIPPFETFEVVKVTQNEDTRLIELHSKGTSSNYNCEWLKDGSVHMAPFHLGAFLLAPTLLAVAAGIL